jgi:hypothetical protein
MPAVPPPGPFGGGGAGEVPQPYAYNDPFQAFLSAVPLMNLNRDQQISDAMATAGFGGNRFGSFAAGKAAEIGGQNALAQNQLLLSTLGDYANRAEDRALAATGLGLQAGNSLDQMMQDRLKLPFQMGAWEQGRGDQMARQNYDAWNQDKLGWFPMMMQLAMSQGSGTPGQIYQTQSDPGKPGLADWLGLFGGLGGLI